MQTRRLPMKSFLILDIETIQDPELPAAQDSDKLPAALHHQIVALGALLMREDYTTDRIGLFGKSDERETLQLFAGYANIRRPDIITFNGRGFDLPVIAMRCLKYGFQLPFYYQASDVRYRFSTAGHMDLMDYVADFGATRSPKLSAIAQLCGWPGKVGVDGSDVERLVSEGKLEDVRSYCLCDVAQTAGVFLRVQLLRGEITREVYLAGMQSLLVAIRGDERLTAVAGGLNEKRLMLEE